MPLTKEQYEKNIAKRKRMCAKIGIPFVFWEKFSLYQFRFDAALKKSIDNLAAKIEAKAIKEFKEYLKNKK